MIIAYMVVGALTVLGAGFIARTVSERNIAQRYVDSVNAFWMAEAGITRALAELRSDFVSGGTGLWAETLTQGRYSVDVQTAGELRKVTAHGFVPAAGHCVGRCWSDGMMG